MQDAAETSVMAQAGIMHGDMGRTLLDLCPLPLPDTWPAGVGQHSAAHLGEGVQHAIPLNGCSADKAEHLSYTETTVQSVKLVHCRRWKQSVQTCSPALLQSRHARQDVQITHCHTCIRYKNIVQDHAANRAQSASTTETSFCSFVQDNKRCDGCGSMIVEGT